ncbi:MAG: 50S ribosomal protein L9 [Eubacterium sp.]|nr:50S ribosomal protein L9 [Eubacterium sp.]
MKIILLQDVKSLGKKGQMVEVNNGYARNYILPKNLGVEATSKNVNDLKLQKAHQDKVAAEQLKEAQELAAALSEKSIQVEMKVGEGGKTFGAISTKEIAAAAKEQLGYELDKKKISVDEPIKSLGSHNVKIKLHPKVTAQLVVKVAEKK